MNKCLSTSYVVMMSVTFGIKRDISMYIHNKHNALSYTNSYIINARMSNLLSSIKHESSLISIAFHSSLSESVSIMSKI